MRKLALASAVIICGVASAAVADEPDPFKVGVIASGIDGCAKKMGSVSKETAVQYCTCMMTAMVYSHTADEVLALAAGNADAMKNSMMGYAGVCLKAVMQYRKTQQ